MDAGTIRLREKEAASYIDKSIPTMRRWRALKVGPAFLKIGKNIFYLKIDLDRYLERCRVETIDPREVAQ